MAYEDNRAIGDTELRELEGCINIEDGGIEAPYTGILTRGGLLGGTGRETTTAIRASRVSAHMETIVSSMTPFGYPDAEELKLMATSKSEIEGCNELRYDAITNARHRKNRCIYHNGEKC